MESIGENKYLFTLAHLSWKDVLTVALKKLGSMNHYYVLQRSLLSLPEKQPMKKRLTIRKISDQEIKEITSTIASLDSDSKKEIISRLIFYKAGFKNCYLARTGSNELAYMQWLVYPDENHIIRKYYRKIFKPIEPGQVMIENAFTFPKFRGMGLLPVMTGELLSIAKGQGYTSVITYVRKDKFIPLNAFIKMDFRITKLVNEYKFVGITTRTL